MYVDVVYDLINYIFKRLGIIDGYLQVGCSPFASKLNHVHTSYPCI